MPADGTDELFVRGYGQQRALKLPPRDVACDERHELVQLFVALVVAADGGEEDLAIAVELLPDGALLIPALPGLCFTRDLERDYIT